MQEFLNFLMQYKELIAIVLSIVLSLLCLLLKKRPQVVDNSILAHLTEWILQAEKLFSVGPDKMNYVLIQAKKYLGDEFVEKDIRSVVEYLLSMPEKKFHK